MPPRSAAPRSRTPALVGPLAVLQRLWSLDHALAVRSRRMLADYGITAEQRFVLRAIGAEPGIAAGPLAQLLRVDPGTLSATLKRLVARRLVARRADPTDARRVALHLTPAGRKLAAPRPGTVEAAVTRVLAETPPRDVARTVAFLERLAEELFATPGRGRK